MSVTEEPSYGWIRIEVEGSKPYYKTPVPRTVIRDKGRLKEYLDKEHSKNRMVEVTEDMFSFKRRLGLRQKKGKIPIDDGDTSERQKVERNSLMNFFNPIYCYPGIFPVCEKA